MKHKLRDYRSHPPYTADLLIVAVNELLAQRGATLISKRTLRFYTAQDVVPGPMGSPKFARYGYEHLLSLLASRALQDQGQKLDQIRVEVSEISRGRLDRLEALVDAWLAQGAPLAGRMLRVRESAGLYSAGSEPDLFTRLAQHGTTSLRINLTPGCILEITDSSALAGELEKAHRELGRLISSVKD